MERILDEGTLRGAVFLLVRLVEAAGALVIFAGAASGFVRFVAAREAAAAMTVLGSAAGLVSALGLAAGVLGVLATREVRGGVPMMLDLWTAAGLLRLATAPSWRSIAGAAALVVVRHLVLLTLRVRAEGSGATPG